MTLGHSGMGLCKRANVLSKRAAMRVLDTRSATVGGLQTLDLLAALAQLGLDRDELCRAAGVDRQALDRPDSRIPTGQFVGILMEAERRRRDPLIGMHAGERCERRGPVAYLLVSHGSLADGLRAITRLAALAVDQIQIDLDIGLDTASVLFHPRDPKFESSSHAVEYLLMATLRILRRPYPDLELSEVDFQHVRAPARRKHCVSSELRCDSPQQTLASCFLPPSCKMPRGSATPRSPIS
jgi:hypothetical protein